MVEVSASSFEQAKPGPALDLALDHSRLAGDGGEATSIGVLGVSVSLRDIYPFCLVFCLY